MGTFIHTLETPPLLALYYSNSFDNILLAIIAISGPAGRSFGRSVAQVSFNLLLIQNGEIGKQKNERCEIRI